MQIMKIWVLKFKAAINKNKNTISCLKSGIKVFGHSKNAKKATILDLLLLKTITVNYIMLIKKIPIYSRADVSRRSFTQKNIIITDSSGKTTTTSLNKDSSDQKLDPTITNGGVINSLNSNAKLGKGEWAILDIRRVRW